MNVRPIAITMSLVEDMSADELLAYIARVSSPQNQKNLDTMPKLLRYCYDNKHWSVFEQADLTVEITTSRTIAHQILRHRSFCFQERSQRYAKALNCEVYEARRQDTKNRQNSFDDLSDVDVLWFNTAQADIWRQCEGAYQEALSRGIAKECARFLLPEATQTTLYMKGNVRSWIHYILIRTHEHAQKEHRDVAEEIKKIFIEQFPMVSEAMGWK